jgi:hypothetical protein
MSRSQSSKTPATRRQTVEVAAALAREAVIQLHVHHALALIREGAGRVTALRMLDIYVRVMNVTGTTAEAVGNRVLAALGSAQTLPEGQGADDADIDAESILRSLRRRLRGRIHHELRQRVELTMGVVQKELLELHTARAHGFLALLGSDAAVADACALYRHHVQMPQPLAAVLYIHVLARIAAEQGGVVSAVEEGATPVRAAPARMGGRAAVRAQRARTTA